ncbi:hypothetical protein HNR23_000495 [Nocardiopsis mwathae]|uniref:Uncharacterized protein n=1 Tax=Nocardiopsis mwathae TaxID=1472723 RepID=A0A7X0D3W4_9ACTN|nr:hypothetical protein [Nocardiopsis mwathae]MBB6170435.1 hypothetical protein [Nocardiopsis mwathae]
MGMQGVVSEWLSSRNVRFSDLEWRRLEAEFNLTFPEDVIYMANRVDSFRVEVRVEAYDTPGFQRGRVERLVVMLPNPSMEISGILDAVAHANEAVSPLFEDGGTTIVHSDDSGDQAVRIPFSFYPESPGLIPWGEDSSGCPQFWVASGESREWPVMVTDEMRFKKHDMSLTGLLEALMSGRLECPISADMWTDPILLEDERRLEDF